MNSICIELWMVIPLVHIKPHNYYRMFLTATSLEFIIKCYYKMVMR